MWRPTPSRLEWRGLCQPCACVCHVCHVLTLGLVTAQIARDEAESLEQHNTLSNLKRDLRALCGLLICERFGQAGHNAQNDKHAPGRTRRALQQQVNKLQDDLAHLLARPTVPVQAVQSRMLQLYHVVRHLREADAAPHQQPEQYNNVCDEPDEDERLQQLHRHYGVVSQRLLVCRKVMAVLGRC